MTPSLSPAEAATLLRDAATLLTRHAAVEPGDLVSAASAERTAALADKLERLGAGDAAFDADDVVTLDSWIRFADSAMLHGDLAEKEERRAIAERLRAVHALIAPGDERLALDPRDERRARPRA